MKPPLLRCGGENNHNNQYKSSSGVLPGMECSEEGCESEATFQLYIPWAENRAVCAGHARVLGRKEGIVADPLETADEELPDGASN